jgi:hypothetical protein
MGADGALTPPPGCELTSAASFALHFAGSKATQDHTTCMADEKACGTTARSFEGPIDGQARTGLEVATTEGSAAGNSDGCALAASNCVVLESAGPKLVGNASKPNTTKHREKGCVRGMDASCVWSAECSRRDTIQTSNGGSAACEQAGSPMQAGANMCKPPLLKSPRENGVAAAVDNNAWSDTFQCSADAVKHACEVEPAAQLAGAANYCSEELDHQSTGIGNRCSTHVGSTRHSSGKPCNSGGTCAVHAHGHNTERPGSHGKGFEAVQSEVQRSAPAGTGQTNETGRYGKLQGMKSPDEEQGWDPVGKPEGTDARLPVAGLDAKHSGNVQSAKATCSGKDQTLELSYPRKATETTSPREAPGSSEELLGGLQLPSKGEGTQNALAAQESDSNHPCKRQSAELPYKGQDTVIAFPGKGPGMKLAAADSPSTLRECGGRCTEVLCKWQRAETRHPDEGPSSTAVTVANVQRSDRKVGACSVPGKGPHFVGVFDRPEICGGTRLCSLDCEMCGTREGLEVTRVSVVDQAGAVCPFPFACTSAFSFIESRLFPRLRGLICASVQVVWKASISAKLFVQGKAISSGHF